MILPIAIPQQALNYTSTICYIQLIYLKQQTKIRYQSMRYFKQHYSLGDQQ